MNRKYIVLVDSVETVFTDIFYAVEFAKTQSVSRQVSICFSQTEFNGVEYQTEIYNNKGE